MSVPTDVCKREDVEALSRAAVERFGRIDVWVNNAGITLFSALEDGPFEQHQRVIETNLFGAMHGARAVVPLFRKQKHGVLINVGSILSQVGQAFVPAYVISKFAVRGLSEALRVELADEPNIHVCSIFPYAIDTPHFENGGNHLGKRIHALPPIQTPEAVALALVGLAEKPQRAVYVPQIAPLGLMLHALMPDVLERTLLDALRKWHVQGEEAISDGNLYAPTPGPGSVHGNRLPIVSTFELVTWALRRMGRLLVSSDRAHA